MPCGAPIPLRRVLPSDDRRHARRHRNARRKHPDAIGSFHHDLSHGDHRRLAHLKLRANLTSFEATRLRHLGTSPHPERYDPDTWTDEFAFLTRPGQAEIQSELFYDYRTNPASYGRWQAFAGQVAFAVFPMLIPQPPGFHPGHNSARELPRPPGSWIGRTASAPQ